MKVCDMRNFQRECSRDCSRWLSCARARRRRSSPYIAIPRHEATSGRAQQQPRHEVRARTAVRAVARCECLCVRSRGASVCARRIRIGLAPRHVHNIGRWFASSCHARRACPSESASGAQRALWLARMAASLRPSRCRRTSSYSRFLARRSRARPRASAIGAWTLSDIRRHNSSSSHTLLLLLPPFPLGGCI